MSKDKIIQNIEGLYPTDCEYSNTNTIGKVLLLTALKNSKFDWRELPENVLLEYERLCLNEENNGEITHQIRRQGGFALLD